MKKVAILLVVSIVAGMGVFAQSGQPSLAALKKAAESGDPLADMFIDEIKPGLTKSQIAEAEKRAAGFQK